MMKVGMAASTVCGVMASERRRRAETDQDFCKLITRASARCIPRIRTALRRYP